MLNYDNVPENILTEKDSITCLLTTLKEMSKNYVTAMTESSNESLFNVYNEILEKVSSLQREVYEVMFRKGWYILEKCDANKINTKYQTLSKEYANLGGE
ncbi:MAG: spore coat protein [Bacilli bacterium]|nr:spore coat protein [Bacilli bacterium]